MRIRVVQTGSKGSSGQQRLAAVLAAVWMIVSISLLKIEHMFDMISVY